MMDGKEMKMEFKKNYRSFWLLMVLFMGALFGCIFLPLEDEGAVTRVLMNLCSLFLALLAWIIHRTEYVYWYTGVDYDQALAAGSRRRKEYARKHLKVFGFFALGYLVFSIVMQWVQCPYWVDLTVGGIGICSVAISTMRFQL